MIIGKDSVWKMLALFAIVAALDVIFCSTRAVYILNALLIAGCLLGGAVKLYQRWSARNLTA